MYAFNVKSNTIQSFYLLLILYDCKTCTVWPLETLFSCFSNAFSSFFPSQSFKKWMAKGWILPQEASKFLFITTSNQTGAFLVAQTVKRLQFRRPGFDSCVGKIPWRRKWQSTPVLLPGKSHGRRSLIG